MNDLVEESDRVATEIPDVVNSWEEWWAWANKAGCTCLDVEAEADCPIRDQPHPPLSDAWKRELEGEE